MGLNKPVSAADMEACRDAMRKCAGNKTEAAKLLGIPRTTLNSRLADDPLTPPEGYRIKGTSTLYDVTTGEAKLQWVKTTEDKERQEAMFRETIAALTEKLPRVQPTDGPKKTSSDYLAGYPISDHHMGMLSWHEETGADYDLSIAERLLVGAVQYLVNATPACDQALLAVLGDFLHWDSYEAVTPASRHLLDADSRYPKMVRAAIRSLRRSIVMLLGKHRSVRVIIEVGNHDPSSAVFLRECLAALYENEPRVSVDVDPTYYHYFEFGKNLIGIHHGDQAKPALLPLIMASDRPEAWGRTEHRFWWTGHVHHDATKDFAGCKVESFRVMAAADSFAHKAGYRAMRDLNAIVLHREHGTFSRHTVNPGMLT